MKTITDKAIHEKFTNLKNNYQAEINNIDTAQDINLNRILIIDEINKDFNLISKVIKNQHTYMFYYSLDNCIKLSELLSNVSVFLNKLDCKIQSDFNLSAIDFLQALCSYHDTEEFLDIFNE